MAVAVTNEQLVLNTVNPITFDAATADTADLAEVYTFTPTCYDNNYIILMHNKATDQGTVTYSIAAGGAWAGSAVLTGSVAQGVMSAIILEGGKYISASGTYVITFTPASGKRLKTDHTFAAVGVQGV